MEDMLFRKVEKVIRDYDMISQGDRLVAGVSGGADSVCLFHVLRKLGAGHSFNMHVLHVHHSIRGREADRDASFVRSLCEEYEVPFSMVQYDVPGYAARHGMSVEEAGRILRREAFEKKAKETGASSIVLAHHMNDVAETVLFNMSRGSGIAGLASLRYARGGYIRPLLCVTREEITAWLRENGYAYCNDSTNEDSAYSRNLIRSEVLPELTANVNNRTIQHFFELSEEAALIESWLAECAETCLEKYCRMTSDSVILKKEMFEAEKEAVYGRAVKSAIGKLSGTLKDIERIHIRSVCGLSKKENGKKADLPYGLCAESVYDEIRIGRKIKKKKKKEMRELQGIELKTGPGNVTRLDDTCFFSVLEEVDGKGFRSGKTEKIYTKKYDYDKIKGTLEIRYRKSGDYLVINSDGRRKSLSDLFTDRKIPREERDRIPLLACGSEILWAVGLRGGESCRIDSDTVRVLSVTALFNLEESDDRQN